jgi:hypothetical protein
MLYHAIAQAGAFVLASDHGCEARANKGKEKSMTVWQGVTMDSLKFHLCLPCPTLLRPTGGSPLKRLYGHLQPLWTPRSVCL